MASITVTNTFVNGTTIDGTEVNTNFTDIINGTSDGSKDFSISALTCAGTATFNGAVNLGNASGDDLTFTGSVASNIPIKTDGSYDIGSTALGLDVCYFGDGGGNTVGIDCPAIASNFIFTLPAHTMTLPASDGAAKDYMQTDGSGAVTYVGGPDITSKTTTYTATTADKVISVTTGSAWTLTLYAASGNAGRTLEIIKTSSDYNVLTIDGNSSETINGATTIVMANQYERYRLLCDGSNWVVLDRTGHLLKPVQYYANAVTSLTNAVSTIVDYATSEYDEDSLVTTGASWKYTGKIAGKFRVTINQILDGSSGWTIGEVCQNYFYVNGSLTKRASGLEVMDNPSNTLSVFIHGSCTLTLTKDQYIDHRVYQASGADLNSGNGQNVAWITVEHIAAP